MLKLRRTPLRPAVFLDRDGTINEEVGYIRDLADLKLIKGAGAAIRRLNSAGIPAVLVTNQSGAARGYYPESWISSLHDRLTELLLDEGALLNAIYYCPHLPQSEGGVVPDYTRVCNCRKPATEMIERAAQEHELDVGRSFVVGDKASDVQLGQNAGSRTILLETGYGKAVLAGHHQWIVRPDRVEPDLEAAVAWILEQVGSGS